MSFESSLTFFIIIFFFSITPGPGVFALLARAMTSGTKECIPLAFGMTISDVIYLIFACLGLATIAHNYSYLFDIIRVLGGLYLLFLAYKMFTTPIDIEQDSKDIKKQNKEFIYSFIQGFLISASNPKVILFYIAFLPTFLDIKSLKIDDIALVSLLTIFSLMLGLMLVSILANQAKKIFKSKKSVKKLNFTAGSIMFLAGSYLLLNRQS